MPIDLPFLRPRPDRRAERPVAMGVGVGVALIHLGLFATLGLVRASSTVVDAPPPIQVSLIPAAPKPPQPPPEPQPAATEGGGTPAAPSVVRLPPKPPERPREVTAPPKPSPEQPLVVGSAPTTAPTPGPGQGVSGSGAGTGSGSGDGPGTGGTRARLVAGPALRDIFRVYPRAAQRARRSGRVQLRCVVRISQRLEACEVVGETPSGMGFAAAALALVETFRAQPATRDGRPLDGETLVVGVEFGPQTDTAAPR